MIVRTWTLCSFIWPVGWIEWMTSNLNRFDYIGELKKNGCYIWTRNINKSPANQQENEKKKLFYSIIVGLIEKNSLNTFILVASLTSVIRMTMCVFSIFIYLLRISPVFCVVLYFCSNNELHKHAFCISLVYWNNLAFVIRCSFFCFLFSLYAPRFGIRERVCFVFFSAISLNHKFGSVLI